MISFDFDFYKAETIEEALELYKKLKEAGKKVLYYAGGTEIVTSFRKESIRADALIDLKNIDECTSILKNDEYLYYGSALNLNTIIDTNYFPMLSQISRKIADHTVRNALTLGGNICGRLPYREAVLAFMLSDSTCIIAGEGGLREVAFNEAYDKRLILKEGEFLVAIKVKRSSISEDYFTQRKVKIGNIDYPIVHIAMVKAEGKIFSAYSGVTGFPIRTDELDDILGEAGSSSDIANQLINSFPYPIRDDIKASKSFRTKLLFEAVKSGLDVLGGGNNE